MRQISSPLLAVFLLVALVVGVLGGYLVSNQINNTQVNQSAFLPYTDNYRGLVDDSKSGFVTNAPLVAGFSKRGKTWYSRLSPPTSSLIHPYFSIFSRPGT